MAFFLTFYVFGSKEEMFILFTQLQDMGVHCSLSTALTCYIYIRVGPGDPAATIFSNRTGNGEACD